MAGVSEVVTLGQFSAWAQSLAAQPVAALNLQRPLKQAVLACIADTKKNFDEGHAPDGTPWAPIAPRPSSRGNDKPLRDKGLLMASVLRQSGQGHVETITATGFEFGTNLEYASIHQGSGPTQTIRPKTAGALSIPLSKEAARYDSPRKFPKPLSLVPRKNKPPLLIEVVQRGKKNKKDFKSIVHYILVKSVTIKARPFLGWSERLLKTIDSIFGQFLTDRFNKRIK